VLTAAAAVLLVAACSGDDGARPSTTTTSRSSGEVEEPTTTTVPEAVPPSAIAVEPFTGSAPASYRITYEIVENELARTETVTVQRPYESLVLSERDGELVSGTATSRSRLWTYLVDREGWLVLQPELHRAAYDQWPLTGMAMAISLGRAEEVGTDAHLGRSCRVFVTGQPLGTSGITAPSDAESTELCIDDDGLVLHERWQIEGSTVVERTATSVETGIEVDVAAFDPTPVVEDAEDFMAALSTIAVPADEETLALLQTDIVPPDGFVLDGTVLRAGAPDRGGATEIVRFYSDGTELIEVAEVIAPAGAQLDGGGAVRVEIEGPETWFFPDFRASAVRSRLSETAFVEIRGTDPAQLVGLLGTLTRR
jgi:hypothetical protein